MPAEFKRRVDEIYGPVFYITSLDGKRAQLYPMKEWEKKEAILANMPASHPARRKFLGRDELLRPDGGDGRTGTAAAASTAAG